MLKTRLGRNKINTDLHVKETFILKQILERLSKPET